MKTTNYSAQSLPPPVQMTAFKKLEENALLNTSTPKTHFAQHISSIANTEQAQPAMGRATTATETLVINQGKEIYRDAICKMLSAASSQSEGKISARLASLVETLTLNAGHPHLDQNEKQSLVKELFILRKACSKSPDKDILAATKHLEKLIYSCLLAEKLDGVTDKYRNEITFFSQPGATKSKSGTANVQISAGSALTDKLVSLKAYGKLSYTQTRLADTDDEGIVGAEKSHKFSAALGAEAGVELSSAVEVKAGAEASAYKKLTTGVNYTGAPDAMREKLAHKTFTYKRFHFIDALTTRKHSLVYHQARAQDSQSHLKTSWEAITQGSIESQSPTPFQATVKTKRVNGIGYSAQVKANAQVASFANAGAKVQYDYVKNDIEVDFHTDMFKSVTEGSGQQARRENLDNITGHFEKAFATLSGERMLLDNQKMRSDLSLDEIAVAVNLLDKRMSDYSLHVQRHSFGDAAATKGKHQFETEWNVKSSGRHGFLQCAEVMLATLASRLPAGPDSAALLEQMNKINAKITNPAFSYDKKKLMPMISFNNLLSIIKASHTVTAEVNATLGTDDVSGGGKVSVALVNMAVQNPYRIRAGVQRDVEITLTGNVTLSNVLAQITDNLVAESGISMDALRGSVSELFSASVDLSAGAKVILRYFSPDWAKKEDQPRRFTHQVTYVQTLKTASLSKNMTVPAAGVFGAGAGLIGELKTTGLAVGKMGTDTLNYLMLRYNYLKGRTEEQAVWHDLIEENRSNLVTLMKNIVTPGTNSAEELAFIYQEKMNGFAREEERETFTRQFEGVKQQIAALQTDASQFDAALNAVVTLMDWHKESTDVMFRQGLIEKEFTLPKKRTLF
nr:hypothetical protein [uncultured Enterobacter sp.]